MTNRAGFAPGEAKEDWAIFRALSDMRRQDAAFRFTCRNCVRSSMSKFRIWRGWTRSSLLTPRYSGGLADRGGEIARALFASPVVDFYLTNPIARASAVMAECSALAKNTFKQAAE